MAFVKFHALSGVATVAQEQQTAREPISPLRSKLSIASATASRRRTSHTFVELQRLFLICGDARVRQEAADGTVGYGVWCAGPIRGHLRTYD